ncbi:DNA repair protein RadC [Neokomagataea thailandica NBRC 106555]|uniref:DNA repair protein RadC n=2 Tax=Neokomagataea TaxID=1223423 RepID=A0A4Y6V8K0_9PROT|nr:MULTISPECIES: DNA repair protein RadC [Neokomagataea]QDH25674.1 DNA repair protein RadC [Neokomagataea tanensis]GBR55301.1 DNA repair protein RadC [Neokomagataea thailandica NBRC 106555]
MTLLTKALPTEALSAVTDIDLALTTGRGRHLSDEVLIAAFIGAITGRPNDDLCHALTVRFASLANVLSANARELESMHDIGTHVVPMLKLLKEASIRYNKERIPDEDILDNEEKLIDYLSARLSRENIEQFRVLFLNEKKILIKDEAQARGTVNHTPVYPREVARRAMELDAAGVILVHNHPSGDPTPSEADLTMTRHVKTALDAVGTQLIDHLIIGNGVHVSFRKQKLF